MFLIRLCFCIVCVDAVAIVFRIFHALRHDFPVRPLLVRLLGATIVAILLIILLFLLRIIPNMSLFVFVIELLIINRR